VTGVVGWESHGRAVRRLTDSFDAIPAGCTVRLAKRTSNLFRVRGDTDTSGLDVSGLDVSGLDVSGLDVSGLAGVIVVDPEQRTADVQGMCTYEDLVDVTLAHAMIPLVVPQLRTITLGGAVSGMGIEATSFRNGLPHESVLEMDILTGAGAMVTTRRGEDLFDSFPNSYGSLGYATRIRIELEPVPGFVELEHVRFDDLDVVTKAIVSITDERAWHGRRVDALDVVVFAPDEAYLTVAHFTDDPDHGDDTAASDDTASDYTVSDYTGQQVYYRSLRSRDRDLLTMHDYLWRWDTDWFWCSRAFGAQHPLVRRLWPRRYRRSDVYHRLVRLEHRFQVMSRIERARGRPARERVVQDVEVPVEATADFLRWFDGSVGMSPVWLCPLRLRDVEGPGSARAWPSYPLKPGTTYVNVGFWGTVPMAAGAADGDVNRAIEQTVTDLGGHKSLYSDAYYDRDTFDRLYNGTGLAAVRRVHDPQQRLTGLYEKAVTRR